MTRSQRKHPHQKPVQIQRIPLNKVVQHQQFKHWNLFSLRQLNKLTRNDWMRAMTLKANPHVLMYRKLARTIGEEILEKENYSQDRPMQQECLSGLSILAHAASVCT
ncbi:hypothetical protein DPMN_160174 [Dreissena polymorpha]|uniref:Uncharacterized protein n=1 Tax=Dreissena polymorpha TaxID=45954 RepID=A0A9D4EPN2_DREPO|nr:hypothetical protein DPMN_160174 [Dreissena polymorpha]